MILARLLSPEDIGIFSLGAVVVGFAHMIRDFGVANYIVQEKELTKERLRTAFGVTLIIAWSAAAALFILSEPLAKFYSEEGVSDVILVLSISFLFIPFSSTILGLFRREMQFSTIFWVNLLSAIAHTTTSLTLAYMDYGYISLAWATVASASTTVLIALFNKPKNAQFIPSLSEFKRIFTFGSSSSAASLLGEAGLSAPDLTISKNLGFESLGFYSRAFGLVSIFNYFISAAIQPLALPIFAKTIRDGEPIKEVYLKSIAFITGLAWPFFIFISIETTQLIEFLYGDQWDRSTYPAQILCLAFGFQALMSFATPALISLGLVHINLKAQLILQPLRLILTLFASFHSIELVAMVQVAHYIFSNIVFHFILNRRIDITFREVVLTTYKSVIPSAVTAITLITLNKYTSFESTFSELLFMGIAWSLSYVLALYLANHPLYCELKTNILKLTQKS